jgi:hypothetical protein
MKTYEIIALCFLVVGFALESLISIWHESTAMRGIGGIALVFGIFIEIFGIAIYEDGRKDE